MTAVELLALIVAALLLQLAVGAGVVVRRRQVAQAARTTTPVPTAAPATRLAPAWDGWRDFRVVARRHEDADATQCSFHLQPVDGLPLPAFRPGQFLTFSLDVADREGGRRTLTRCYSLSDGPGLDHYRVTIKRVSAPDTPPGLAPGLASNHFHDHVQVGDVLRVKAPSGHFFLDPDPALPVVLVGGGIGITPMMSMLAWCTAQQPHRRVHVYYGVRHGGEHAFRQPLQDLAASHPSLRLHVAYSRPAATDVAGRDYQHAGHVDTDLLRRTLPHGRHQFYICGPAAMMHTLVPALADWGVPDADLHFEAFGPASIQRPAAPQAEAQAARLSTPTVEVRFTRSGRTLAWDGRDASLLDLAERHGVEVESGCRSGGCGSCETRVLEGEVAYAHAPDHDVAAGSCLLCVGRPATPLVLEA